MSKIRGGIFGEALLLLVLHGVGVMTMANWRIMDQLLSPAGSPSLVLVALSVIFMCLRLFLICFFPGWILARAYVALISDASASKSSH